MLIASVFDKKASKFNALITETNVATFLRAVGAECSRPKTNLNMFPEDYEFYKLGEFNEITGKFNIEKEPVLIGKATDYVKKPEEPNKAE